jgi:hypothetical protein
MSFQWISAATSIAQTCFMLQSSGRIGYFSEDCLGLISGDNSSEDLFKSNGLVDAYPRGAMVTVNTFHLHSERNHTDFLGSV